MDVRGAGFDAVIEKPVDFTVLCNAIKALGRTA